MDVCLQSRQPRQIKYNAQKTEIVLDTSIRKLSLFFNSKKSVFVAVKRENKSFFLLCLF